jgi:serine protease Do
MKHNVALPLARVAAALVIVACGAGTEGRAQYARRTPIVEAVAKTRASIVAIQAHKKSQAGREKATGTGVIVDGRGYVLSNLHVVADSSRVQIALADGTEIDARIVMQDADNDLAILRVQTDRRLTALPLGPGGDLLIGETVIAIGHPFGYRNTVSTGIISALGREVTMPSGAVLTNLIQTDASINPGNSGGPLLNINGELIGLNVALREGAQGIAFAINVDTVKEVLSRQLSALRIAGIEHGLVCAERVEETTCCRQHVVVAAVGGQTPAAMAGLERGDEIRQVADQSVANRFDVERALWDHRAGEKIPLTVRRRGQDLKIELLLAPANTVVQAAKNADE